MPIINVMNAANPNTNFVPQCITSIIEYDNPYGCEKNDVFAVLMTFPSETISKITFDLNSVIEDSFLIKKKVS